MTSTEMTEHGRSAKTEHFFSNKHLEIFIVFSYNNYDNNYDELEYFNNENGEFQKKDLLYKDFRSITNLKRRFAPDNFRTQGHSTI